MYYLWYHVSCTIFFQMYTKSHILVHESNFCFIVLALIYLAHNSLIFTACFQCWKSIIHSAWMYKIVLNIVKITMLQLLSTQIKSIYFKFFTDRELNF